VSVASRFWVRRLTSITIVLVLIAIAVVITQRFNKFRAPVAQVDSDEVAHDGSDRMVGVYTGFEFVERVAGRLIFELASKRTLGLSSGWHEIEGVSLQFYRDGEPGPMLTCDGASFNIQTRDATLEGSIRIVLPSGAMLTTEAGKFEASSRRFATNSEVTFVSGASFGRAQSAVFDLEEDEIVLSGGVILNSEDGTTLTAQTAVFQRSKGAIVFPAGGKVRFQQGQIEAPLISVDLEKDDGPARRIELAGGVIARAEGLSDDGTVVAWIERVVAKNDGKGRWQVDGSTTGPWITVRFVGGEGYFERTLRTWILRAVLNEEGLINLRAERGICFDEVPIDGALRSGEAREARVWFSDGKATDVELLHDVILRGEGIEARGYRVRLSPEAGLTMLHGDPTGPERVLLLSPKGRVSCDQAQLFNDEGRAEARGNVQGIVQGVALMGGGEDEEGSEPAHFAAEILDVTENGAVYHLREHARLWQGHRLLLADDVVYRHDIPSVRAAGHVRTTVPASQLDIEGDPGEDVVVVARSLDFNQVSGRAVYRGNVRYSDPKHTLSAAEVSLFFNENNEVTAVEAVGSVEMVEVVTGRRMIGQKARREVSTQMVTIEGSPVKLSDPSGSEVSGSSLTWNQADGTVSVAGGTETIYYPEEQP